jgi:hypothetical protein
MDWSSSENLTKTWKINVIDNGTLWTFTANVMDAGTVRANLNLSFSFKNLFRLTTVYKETVPGRATLFPGNQGIIPLLLQTQDLYISHTCNIGQYNHNRLFSTFFPLLKTVLFLLFFNINIIFHKFPRYYVVSNHMWMHSTKNRESYLWLEAHFFSLCYIPPQK